MAKKGTVQLILEVNGKPAALEYQKLSKQLDQLIKEQSELNKETKEYGEKAAEIKKVEAEMKKLEPTISNLNKEKRKLTKELKNMTIGSEEYIKTSARLKEVNTSLKNIRKETSGYSKEAKKAEKGTAKLKKGFSTLAQASPFSALLGPLGLVIGAITGLIGLFTKSERGAKMMAQATGFFNAVIGAGVKLINDFIGKVQEIFTTSETPLRDFGKMIVENIQNRIKGAIEGVTGLGRALGKLLKGQFKEAGEEARKAGSAFLQAATGLDKEKVKEVTETVKEQTKAFTNLALAKRNSVRVNARLTKELEDLITQETLLTQAADDATLSFKDRNQAQQDAIKIGEERAKKEIQLAKVQAGLLNDEIRLRRANGEDINSLLEAQIGATSAIQQAERELLTLQQENATKLRQLRQDEVENYLDILIDGFDKQKTVNERLIASDLTTHEQRVKLLEDTQTAFDKTFDLEIAKIQELTDHQIDANDLLNESDAVRLNKKIQDLGLSEVISKRLLEVINERKIGLLDLAEKEQEINDKKAEDDQKQAEKTKASQEKALKDELDLLQKKFETRKLIEDEALLEELTDDQNTKEEQLAAQQEHNDLMLSLELDYLRKRADIIEKAGQDATDIKAQLAQKELSIAQQKSDKELELEQKTADTKAAIKEQTRALLQDSLSFLIEALGKDEEARRKNASIIKAFEIGQVFTNLYSEISSIWKNSTVLGPIAGPILAGAQTALAAGRATLAVQNIRSQTFASGGYTGDGLYYDNTGHKVAGIVHDGEYVAPKWQVNHPIYGEVIRGLEDARLAGYAGGGFVNTAPSRESTRSTQEVITMNNNMIGQKLDTLINIMGSLPRTLKAEVVYDQFKTIETEQLNSENLGSL